jgi:hypothetical protein
LGLFRQYGIFCWILGLSGPCGILFCWILRLFRQSCILCFSFY